MSLMGTRNRFVPYFDRVTHCRMLQYLVMPPVSSYRVPVRVTHGYWTRFNDAQGTHARACETLTPHAGAARERPPPAPRASPGPQRRGRRRGRAPAVPGVRDPGPQGPRLPGPWQALPHVRKTEARSHCTRHTEGHSKELPSSFWCLQSLAGIWCIFFACWERDTFWALPGTFAQHDPRRTTSSPPATAS